MNAPATFAHRRLRDLALAHRRRNRIALVILAGFCLGLGILSLGVGAFSVPPTRIVQILLDGLSAAATPDRDALIILHIRLPRLLLGFLVGAGLGVSGALMQGLFRNPLADPGLVGVSAGAGLAAAITIVLGDRFLSPYLGKLPFAALPFGAFVGGLASTSLLYAIATRQGRTSISTMLLAGVALGAMAGALTGFLTFLSNDAQLRDLTFWALGSLGGASWSKVATITPLILLLLVAVPFLARSLNALALGEAEAFNLGIPVQRVKVATIVLVAVAIGASVSTAGLIGFVGIVVPHLLRLVIGPGHRMLLPLSALLGGAMLVGADTLARILVAPAELPIGILTAAVGAPFFLWLLLKRDRSLA